MNKLTNSHNSRNIAEKQKQNFVSLQQNIDDKYYVEVSTPRYSDISSQYLRLAKQKSKVQVQQISPIFKQSYQKQHLIPDNKYELDSQQFISIFGDDDSLLSVKQLISEGQFRDISKKAKIEPATREQLIYKFYKKNKSKGQLQNYDNKYYSDYLLWKDKTQKYDSQLERPNRQAKMKQINNEFIKDNMIKKQLQSQAYKNYVLKKYEQQSYQQMKKNLKQISQEYHNKLNHVINSKNNFKNQYQQNRRERSMQKNRQLGFQKIQYPILNAIDAKTQEQNLKKRKEEQILKWKQINQKSFVDIIKRPPKAVNDFKTIQIPIINKKMQTNANNNQKNNKLRKQQSQQIKLDIQGILKIPYKKFLIFYNQNEHKIASLCSPEQLKKINKYRKQALERQEALEKLKYKISMSGHQVINKLSPAKKDRLFKILYEDQVQQEKLQNY